MIRSLLLTLYITAAVHSQFLHVTVVEACVDCVMVWRASGLFVPDHFHEVTEAHRNWQPNQSQLLTGNTELVMLPNKDAPAVKIERAGNWTIIVQREFISMHNTSWKSALPQLETTLQRQIVPLAHIIFAKPDWLTDLDEESLPQHISIVKSEELRLNPDHYVQQVFKQYASTSQPPMPSTKEQQLFQAIMLMCEGHDRWTRMNQLELIKATSNPVYRQQLLKELESTIQPACSDHQNHILFAMGTISLIGWVLWDCMSSYRLHKKPYSSI